MAHTFTETHDVSTVTWQTGKVNKVDKIRFTGSATCDVCDSHGDQQNSSSSSGSVSPRTGIDINKKNAPSTTVITTDSWNLTASTNSDGKLAVNLNVDMSDTESWSTDVTDSLTMGSPFPIEGLEAGAEGG